MDALVDKQPLAQRGVPPKLSVLRRRSQIHIEHMDVDGVRLRIGIQRGRGRPMLVFNGIGANLDMTLPLAQALDGVEVIVFDMPGAGESPALTVPRRFAGLARLAVKLLDRLGYDEPLNIAGFAWGGALAQQFALDFPDRTNRLVLAATSVGMWALPARAKILKRLTGPRYTKGTRETLAALAPERYGGLVRWRPELLERRGVFASHSAHGYIHQLLAGLGWTSIHRLPRLRCPTLIMGGDDDPVMPLVNSRLLYWLIPKSYLHIVRGGGHLFLLVRANESAAVIKRFINERRYDGTDQQDYFAARNLPPDGTLKPLSAVSTPA